tara:strand:- start:177 stop:323 length:147 start_codon:yes stop_codon:yes gene_type:complete
MAEMLGVCYRTTPIYFLSQLAWPKENIRQVAQELLSFTDAQTINREQK